MSKHTFLRIVRFWSRVFLRIIANIDIDGRIYYPEGAYILAGNHIGRLEAFLVMLMADRDDIIMILAEKYKDVPVLRYFANKVDAIWVNRFDADFQALRTVLKRLKLGEVLAIAPEGTRSETEALIEGKEGAAYLAWKSGAPIIPVGITGTEDRIVKQRLKRLQRLDIKARVGLPFELPPKGDEDRDDYLLAQTDEIMCQIAAQLPPDHRGVYSDHPRLHELLLERGSPYPEDASLLATAGSPEIAGG